MDRLARSLKSVGGTALASVKPDHGHKGFPRVVKLLV